MTHIALQVAQSQARGIYVNEARRPLVLVLDDEALIAFDLAATIEDLGAKVLGPATSLKEGFALCEQAAPHYALLDIDVSGQLVWPLARHLAEQGSRVIFVSANANHRELKDEFDNSPVVDKPAGQADIVSALGRAGFPNPRALA
ncbi:MAG: hypothetical protein ABGW87_13405 [Sphingomonadaceae bacterium]